MYPKVLITGASGLLGGNLVLYMLQQQFDIRILVRKNSDLKTIQNLPIEVHYGNISNKENINNAIKGCDYVIHAASLTSQYGVKAQEYYDINVEATKIIALACLEHKIKRLIYISTANTIGCGTKDNPGTELNAFGLSKINSGYVNSKYLALQMIQEMVQQQHLPAIIISPTFMIGAHDTKPSSGQLLLHALNKKLLVFPQGGKSFVHVLDVCNSIVQALTKGTIGEQYLIAGENLSYGEFYGIVDCLVNKKTRKIIIPRYVLISIGHVSSFFEWMSNRTFKLNYTTAYLLSQDNYYSGEKAKRDLEIEYNSISTAVFDALEWFKKEKYF